MNSQLAEDVLDVELHGMLRHAQPPPYGLVGFAPAEGVEDFRFPLAELISRVDAVRGTLEGCSKRLDKISLARVSLGGCRLEQDLQVGPQVHAVLAKWGDQLVCSRDRKGRPHPLGGRFGLTLAPEGDPARKHLSIEFIPGANRRLGGY